jgi:hypothetical protein
LAAGATRNRPAHRVEDAGIGLGLRQLFVAVADARQWPNVGDAARHRDRRLAQIGALLDQLVDDAEPLCFFGRNVAARTIISIAAFGPISRGNRWVPPLPGNMPIRTSGRPTLALGTAMR